MFLIEQYFLLTTILLISLWTSWNNKHKNLLNALSVPIFLFIIALFAYVFSGRGDAFNLLAFLGRWLCFASIYCLLLFFIYKHVITRIISVLAVISLSVLFYGYQIEPLWLEVREYQVNLPVKEPLTIVVLADFQADEIGRFERNVFSRIKELVPDLLLLPGDYLHLKISDNGFNQLKDDFKKLLSELPDFKYGAYAVSGDVETRQPWKSLFEGSSVLPFDGVSKNINNNICLSGLGIYASRRINIKTPKCDKNKVHIIFGHNPNFALSKLHADLLIAGHTHGGQVQVPLLGPLITFSKVPNSWADGLTQITNKQTLVVSRGVGMERKYAPRVRFFARPELTVIRIVPEG